MRSDGFRAAVEGEDLSSLDELFLPDAVFRSPAVHRPYEGLDALQAILEAVISVFEDFRYLEQVEADELATLLFAARVGDRELEGVDLLRFAPDGRISELTVMVRPLSGVKALAEAMGRRLDAANRAGRRSSLEGH